MTRFRWIPRFSMHTAAALLLCLALPPAWGAAPPDDPGEAVRQAKRAHELEAQRRAALLQRLQEAGAQPSQAVDVIHYSIEMRVDPYLQLVSGTVAMRFRPTSSLDTLRMRLWKRHDVLEAAHNAQPADVKRKKSNIKFRFHPPLDAGSEHEVSVTYSGYPEISGELGGGMLFAEHGGTPSATTLSEPFESYTWWPCVDEVNDKATYTVALTVPPDMTGASNGTLLETWVEDDGWNTFLWDTDYPMSNYLFAVNVTNYETHGDVYTSLDGLTDMPIDHYVYPEHYDVTQLTYDLIPDMIAYFAERVGEYPFLDEKYGQVEFPWGGAMEHQTLTSMGDFAGSQLGNYEAIISHELAHQWFGDEVSPETWNEIWLNEGFATYFEVLWIAHSWGYPVSYVLSSWFDDHLYNGQLKGSPYRYNENKPFGDTGAIYDKGAWVLHMLRHVMGDDAFFEAIRDYRESCSYANANTDDLKASCEASYGGDLDWFFEQWVYSKKRPIYKVSWEQAGQTLSLTVKQKQKHKIKKRNSNKNVYVMPIDVTLYYENGSEETVTVWNDRRNQTFDIAVPDAVEEVGFDEGSFILKVLK